MKDDRHEVTANRQSSNNRFNRLRAAALMVTASGALGSVSLMLYAGRNNPHRLITLLFVVWVLSPFVILVLAHMISKRWSILTRATLYVVMLFVTIGSLIIYGHRILWPPSAQPAFVFVAVPPSVVVAFGSGSSNSSANIGPVVSSLACSPFRRRAMPAVKPRNVFQV